MSHVQDVTARDAIEWLEDKFEKTDGFGPPMIMLKDDEPNDSVGQLPNGLLIVPGSAVRIGRPE